MKRPSLQIEWVNQLRKGFIGLILPMLMGGFKPMTLWSFNFEVQCLTDYAIAGGSFCICLSRRNNV
jgi:hypothetical protein